MSTSDRPIVRQPVPHPRRWDHTELSRLASMVEQDSLFYWRGRQTEALTREFQRHYPLGHVFPTSSGSAAIHVAVASLRLQPGDEVIVPAITDMGSVIGIIYQQGVPVFADLERGSLNLDPADVSRRTTAKTRAILAVHIAGNPCDMASLRALATKHRLVLIEDCAQAWGARWQGQPVGLSGQLAAYSFNDYKHLSCGDGGIVATNDALIGTELSKWGDKYYDRSTGERDPAEFAPNYRMSEPQAAVAAAQLTKLPYIAEHRTRVGRYLNHLLQGIPGLLLPEPRRGDSHSYWFYLIRLDLARFKCTRQAFATALAAEGVDCTAGYIPKPVYRYQVFQNHNFFGGHWPVRDFGLTQMNYRETHCPEAEAIIADSIKLTVNEAMTDDYLDKVAEAVCAVVSRFSR